MFIYFFMAAILEGWVREGDRIGIIMRSGFKKKSNFP